MAQLRKCPRCGGALLWNGRGLSCIACPYFSAQPKPPSEIKLATPRKKRPDEDRT